MRRCFLIIFYFLINIGYSQKTLDLHYYTLFGKEKVFQFFNNSVFYYKLKGDLFFKKNKIVNLQDSILVFDNDSTIKLSQIKAIKILGGKFSPYIFGIGIGFFVLDTGNNIAFNNSQILSMGASIVLISSIVTGLIVKRIQNKHIRINKNCTFRIIDNDFQHINFK